MANCPICRTALIGIEKNTPYCTKCHVNFWVDCPCGTQNGFTATHCYTCHRSLQGILPISTAVCRKCFTDFMVTTDEARSGNPPDFCSTKCENAYREEQRKAKQTNQPIVSSTTFSANTSSSIPSTQPMLGREKETHAPVLHADPANWRDSTIGHADGQNVKLSYDKRTLGVALIGKNGTGKSSLIQTILSQEMAGVDVTRILFDPHGELAQNSLKAHTKAGKQVYWITPETTTPFGLNLFETDATDYLAVDRTVNVTIEIFKKIIGSDAQYMPRFEYIMGSVARTIIYANAGYTLAEVPLFLTDLQFAKNASQKLTNPELRRFWQEYEQSFWDKTGKVSRPYDRFLYLESVANRISTLLQNELLYRIVSHSRSTIRFSDLLESGNCILFSLPMGKLGEGATSLLGSILLAKFAEAIYSRGLGKRRVHLYIDEYGRYFSTPFTADLLTQGRKYNVSTLVTMQTLQQLPDEQNMAAVLNAGNLLCFQLIGKDAEILAKQFPLPGPLPEPINTLTPYTLSPTPVEDIWKKGHPSPQVIELRDSLLILLHRLETEPYEKVFSSPQLHTESGRELQKIFSDMEEYSSDRGQIAEGFDQLNKLLVQGQKEPEAGDYDKFFQLMFFVLLLFRGYMGIYPQNRKETDSEYARWAEKRAQKGLMDPRQATGYEWVARIIRESDAGALMGLCAVIMEPYPTEDDKQLMGNYSVIRLQAIKRDYPTLALMFQPDWWHRSEDYEEMIFKRIRFEMENVLYWIKLLLSAITALRKSPVVTQASTYAGGRTWERSQADMRDELIMRLASLPSYTAICQLLYNDGSTQSSIVHMLKG